MFFTFLLANILQRKGINATSKKAKDKSQSKKAKSDLKKDPTKSKSATTENQVEKDVDKEDDTLTGKVVVVNKATEDNVSISIVQKQETDDDDEEKTGKKVEPLPEKLGLNNLGEENGMKLIEKSIKRLKSNQAF